MEKKTEKKKPSILEIAKKRRHVYLLKKIKSGKNLSSQEVRELQRLEGDDNLPAGTVNTIEQIAKAFHVSVRTVDRWVHDGMPRTAEGNYDLTEIQAWRFVKNNKPGGKSEDDKKWESKYREIKALLYELEYRKKLGQLVEIEEVERGRVQRIMAVKKALLSLPRRLAPQVAGLDVRQAEAVIDKRIREIINDFAKGE